MGCLIQEAFSCSCFGELSIKEEIKRSNVVVTGVVISKTILKYNGSEISYNLDSIKINKWGFINIKYKILVENKHKGNFKKDTIYIVSGSGGDCGYEFEIGKKYIIYSFSRTLADFYGPKHKSKMRYLYTDICTRTRPFEDEEYNQIRKKTRT
jgi:hypothetical protein